MPLESDPYPVELTTEEDLDWAYLRDQILSSVDWEEHQPQWEEALGGKKE